MLFKSTLSILGITWGSCGLLVLECSVYQVADFGDTQGIRMYGIFLLPTGQDLSKGTEEK